MKLLIEITHLPVTIAAYQNQFDEGRPIYSVVCGSKVRNDLSRQAASYALGNSILFACSMAKPAQPTKPVIKS